MRDEKDGEGGVGREREECEETTRRSVKLGGSEEVRYRVWSEWSSCSG